MDVKRALPLACLLALLIGGPDSLRGSDLSILGTYASGDFGGNVDNSVQSTWIRFATGDRFQFRAAAPYVRLEVTDDVVVQPVVGVLPTRSRSGQGSARGQGSGTGSGEGNNDSAVEEPSGEDPTTAEYRTTASGLGDLWLSGFARLLGGGASIYRLDTGLEVKAPIADEEQLLGTGEWDYRLVVSGEYRFWTASTFGTLGWNYLGDPEWVELNDAFDVILGAESDPLWDRFIVTGWLEGNQEIVDGLGDRAAAGIGFRSLGRFRWRVLATVGLTRAAEDLSFGFGLSLGIEPPKTGVGGPRL